ncbi:hypothetical protein JTE90_000337 [Oedothorax gibbosus]|uniref:Uncharacterized protein n=1 Tax=Oedothorax gibbosus TaxID=931172 RepID=A0AAV6U0X8_9ARAC|nr:hypothetical protein JTE90_000337 [Oedothorax gibbosus]
MSTASSAIKSRQTNFNRLTKNKCTISAFPGVTAEARTDAQDPDDQSENQRQGIAGVEIRGRNSRSEDGNGGQNEKNRVQHFGCSEIMLKTRIKLKIEGGDQKWKVDKQITHE